MNWLIAVILQLLYAVHYNKCTEHDDYNSKDKGLIFDAIPGSILSFPINTKDIQQQTTQVPDKMECVFACIGVPWCQSMNFQTTAQNNGLHVCELLSTDKYAHPNNMTQNSTFIHLFIKSDCSNFPCLHNFTCIPDYDSDTYECSCPRPPFEGKNCKDVDECTTGQHNCSVNAYCTNIIGSFKCTCKDDYFGNGTTCHNILTIVESDILRDYGNDSYFSALKHFMDQVPEDIVNVSWIRCWSGKKDGFDVTTTFHPQCDGKGPTVTIVRKAQYVWGGYTDVPWSSPISAGSKNSSKSFVFSLYNIHGFSPMRFDVVRTETAVLHYMSYGPKFHWDVFIDNNAATSATSYNEPYSYATPPNCVSSGYCNFYTNIWGPYTINDVEVFYKQT